MDHLKPPVAPASTASAADIQAGATIFTTIGCAVCHQPGWVTAANTDASLNQIAFKPYSDFLLHDMGPSGDQIPQGVDSANRAISGSWMRTTPLWGVGQQSHLWHDGTAATIPDAINRHAGQGTGAKTMFLQLAPAQQQQLVAFLKSL